MSIALAEQDLAQLRSEITRLESQLAAAHERAIKVAHYVEMAREYQGDGSGTVASPPAASRLRAPQGGMSGAAVRETIALLRENSRPIHTRDLIPLLEQRGIRIGGANPLTNLSGYLSRSEELLADRSRGWFLKEWEFAKPTTAQSAPLEPGVDSDAAPTTEAA